VVARKTLCGYASGSIIVTENTVLTCGIGKQSIHYRLSKERQWIIVPN